MNYYELHIGDYDKATAHLTACEDGIYGRLIRRYYDTESPLPLDVKSLQRLVRARSRDEKEAVPTLLEEFFEIQDDGWHHKRCDQEIAKFMDKREKAKRSAEARWNTSERNANASAETMRTHCEGNAHQTPSTSHQSPDSLGNSPTHTEFATGSNADGVGSINLPPPIVIAVKGLRQLGVRTTPQNPELIAAMAEGVTPDALIAMAESYPGKPAGYVILASRRQHAEGAAPTPRARGAPNSKPSIAQQFANKSYEGTPDEQLPAYLRPDAA